MLSKIYEKFINKKDKILNMKNTILALTKFGLSEKESKVYLACLELGEATAYDIALKTHLPRTLIYDLFKRLMEQGIASFVIKNKKKYFSVVNPEELIQLLKEKEDILKSSLKDLKRLQRKKTKLPKINVHISIEGIKIALDDVLKSDIKELYTFGSSGISFQFMSYYIQHWHMRRIKKKIKVKMIYNDTEETRKRIKNYPETLRLVQYKFLPITYSSPTVFIIYNNKLIMIYWTKEPVAIVIESKEIVENQKQYFRQLWKIAKK